MSGRSVRETGSGTKERGRGATAGIACDTVAPRVIRTAATCSTFCRCSPSAQQSSADRDAHPSPDRWQHAMRSAAEPDHPVHAALAYVSGDSIIRSMRAVTRCKTWTRDKGIIVTRARPAVKRRIGHDERMDAAARINGRRTDYGDNAVDREERGKSAGGDC